VKSTRQRILEILDNRPGITAAELSRALQLTQADIRHHLSNMVAEGLVTSSGQQKTGRRGRPARRFSLSASVHKDNFDLLSSALLNTALHSLSPNQQSTYLEQVASRLVPSEKTKGPLSQRLVKVINHLNDLGYQSRWEAHSDAPRIIFERCPFAKLRIKHPELCRLDAKQIAQLSAEPVTLVESNAHLDDGFCLFLVGSFRPE
jgi:predicted ArsR family transcriptional regulator